MKIKYFLLKCNILELFYLWVDQGYEHDMAAGQFFYYQNFLKTNIEEFLACIIITNRFLEAAKTVPDWLDKKLSELNKIVDKSSLVMTLEEKEMFESDYKDVKHHIDIIAK